MTAWNPGTECESPWGALILFSSFSIYMLNGGCFFTNGLLLPEFQGWFGASQVTTTWLTSIQIGLCQFSGIIGGPLIELYGCRVVCVTGTVLISVGYMLSSFITDIRLMFVTYSILPGMGLGLQFIPCMVAVQYYFEQRRTLAVGILSSGAGMGSFVFAVFCRYLLNTYGFQNTMLVHGAIILHGIPLALLMTSHPKTKRKAGSLETQDALSDDDASSTDGENTSPQTSEDKHQNDNNKIYKLRSELDVVKKMHGYPTNHVRKLSPQSYSKPDRSNSMDLNTYTFRNGSTKDVNFNRDRTLSRETFQSMQSQSQLHQSLVSVVWKRQKTVSFSETEKEVPASTLMIPTTEPPNTSVLRELKRTIQGIGLGFKELENVAFLVIFLSIFFNCLGFQAQYLFLPCKAMILGCTKWHAAMLISIIGLSDTVGRLLCGWLGNLFEKQMLMIFAVGIFLSGLASLGSSVLTSYSGFVITCVLFGLGSGTFNTLYFPLIFEEVGMAKVARAIGITGIAYGLGLLISPQTSAYLLEATNNINVPFYLSASFQFFAAALLVFYRCSPYFKAKIPEEIGSIGDINLSASRDIPRLTMSNDTGIKSSLSLGLSRDVLYYNSGHNRLDHTGVVVMPAIYASVASVNTLRSTFDLPQYA